MVYTVKLKKNNTTWKIICDNFDIRNIIHEDMPQFGNKLLDIFATNTDKFWTIVPLDMGNCMYAKHNYVGGSPSSIFVFVMLADSWGQYGETTSDVPKLVSFIPEEYNTDDQESKIFLDEKRKFSYKCPTCKTISWFDPMKDKKVIFQLPEGVDVPKCSICMINDIEVYSGGCGHTQLCQECTRRMKIQIT